MVRIEKYATAFHDRGADKIPDDDTNRKIRKVLLHRHVEHESPYATHGENHERGIERHPEWPELGAPVPQSDVRPGERRPAIEICELRHGADGAFSQGSQH